MKKIAIAAAGTGGHIFPGLSVGKVLIEKGVQPYWFGTPIGLENKLVDKAQYKFYPVNMQGVRGKGLVRWLLMPFALGAAVLEAKEVLAKEKIEKVLLCGGYVTVPVGLAAKWLKIPIVLLEQNAAMGLSNRVLSYFASKIFCGFPCGLKPKKFKNNQVQEIAVIGNPVREEISAIAPSADLLTSRPLHVLVMGGSLGALAINQTIPEMLKLIKNPVQVLHQTGEKTFQATLELYQKSGLEKGVKLVPFLENMAHAYAWADVVICRAGALTVSEVAAAGRTGIFIPLPIAVDDHQTKNAKYLVSQNAAKLISQGSLKPELLANILDELNTQREKIVAMGVAAKALSMPGSAGIVAKALMS